MERATKDWVSRSQQGFLPGRSLLENVVSLDTQMRVACLTQPDPAAILFDFKAAFPSLSHGSLMMVLARCGIPTTILVLVPSLNLIPKGVVSLQG